MITYAQNFEDVMLERLFAETNRGFYVDIGAWDPNDYSVTRHFYQRGWRGLNVEPIASRHARFVERRPRDINVRALVGSGKQPTRFYECVEEDYLSTTVADVANELRANGLTINEYEVNVERLDALIERYCPKGIEFLKLDVEGSEADVLTTIDLKRLRPRALVIEATIPGSGLKSWDDPDAFANWAEWEEGVLSQGYIFARFDGLNRFYVRREDERLAARLYLPPGIFDGIDPSHSPQAEADARLEVIEQQQIEIEALRETNRAAQQSSAEPEQDSIASRTRIEALTHECAELERNLAVFRGRAEAAENLVAEQERQRIATLAQIDALAGERAKLERGLTVLRARAEAAENLMLEQEQHRVAAQAQTDLLAAERAELERDFAVLSIRAEQAEACVAEQERQRLAAETQVIAFAKERVRLEQESAALQIKAAQLSNDVSVANDRAETVNRQLSDALNAIELFEEWFDSFNANPINASGRDSRQPASKIR